jgi:alkylation response protein AidB-like acyl-CoA dehydrogenase
VVDRAENLMGIRGGKAYALTLDCRVPASNLLGHEGDGFKLAMKVLDNSRLDVAATCLGIAQAALVCTTAWVKERMVGGKPLNMRQGVQWTLADMGCQLEAAWGLTLQAAHLRACQQPFTMAASMAKLFASEMVSFVTDRALQLHGGYGYTQELPLERFVRDARIMRIYEGSSEIQRTVIGRLLTS